MIKIDVSKINRKVIKYSHWKLSCSEANPQAFGRNSAFAKLIESLVSQFSPPNHVHYAVLCRGKHIGLKVID